MLPSTKRSTAPASSPTPPTARPAWAAARPPDRLRPRDAVLESARAIASRLSAGRPAPVSVVDCFARADHRRALVLDEAIHPRVRGAVDLHRGRWLVLLNAADDPRRARFTLAHELGHVVLGDVLRPPGASADTPDLDHERVCDQFAAELLMPAPLVRAAWRAGPSVAALADRFDVPVRAMERRLAELGLG